MSNRIAFQTQLASIMEVLANAAVAEICKLVDDDYAVINLQMTQCQRENKALKRKLHILELKMARGLAERRIGSLSRANRVHVTAAAAALTDKYRNQNNDVAFGGQFNAGLWSDAGSGAGGEQKPLGVSNSMTGETISDIENVLIKVEAFEEAPTQQSVFMGDCGLAASPSQTTVQMVNEVGDDQVSRMQRQTLEVSGSDTALKSELKVVDVKGKSPERFDLNGESSPQGDYVSQGDGSNFPHPPCAHRNDPRAASRPSRQSEVIEVDSADDGEEITAWTRKPVDPFPPSTLSHFGKNDLPDGRMLLTSFNPHLTSTDLVAVASSSKTPAQYFHRNIQHANLNQQAFGRMGNDKVPCEKRFACTYCGKVFNRPKKVVIHQRIHTGEKPFKCLTCGKLFAEAGNLRKHQKVHTGERPYSCSQCGQAFAWIRNLKSHQQKYHSQMLRAEEHLAAVSHI